MLVEERYTRGERRPFIRPQIRKAKRGVYRGSLNKHNGSWYQRDKGDAVLSVPTITKPQDGESDDSVLSSEYRRVRGIMMHDYLDHSGGRRSFSEEYNGEWEPEWEAVSDYDPSITPPEEFDFEFFGTTRSEEARRLVAHAAEEQANLASTAVKLWWLDEVDQTFRSDELMFVVSDIEDIRGYGGQIDRVVRIDEGVLPAGLYVVEYKLTHDIYDHHYEQVEAYRRAFWPDLGPLDGLILRVDPMEQDVEFVSTHDDEWPDDAWTDFLSGAKDEYNRNHMVPDLQTSPRY